MIKYSGPIHEETLRLLDGYASTDPYGIWDDAEWEAYARKNGSENFQKYMDEKGKYWFYCEKCELDGANENWDSIYSKNKSQPVPIVVK